MTQPAQQPGRSKQDYSAFLASKRRVFLGDGVRADALPSQLFDWQAAIVRWALKKGRAAIWADCGLGKTFMQVAWADALRVSTIILAPLCVAEQTVAEAEKIGIAVTYVREQADVRGQPIVVTNYERLDKFDLSNFRAVVLDESSILKAFNGKTRTALIRGFAHTQYRLCCTATPSPNDIAELANHAEFLGLMTRPEFLATWFVHDDTGWRMKKHAVEPFYRWLASWAISLRSPADLGYDATGFTLPPLHIRSELLLSTTPSGTLFPEMSAKGLCGRLDARRSALPDRVKALQRMTLTGKSADGGCAWLLWCGLNEESDALAEAINGAVNVQGSDSYEVKAAAVKDFIAGRIRVLITKPKILGFGMNFQHAHHMAFVGLSDSYETYYQCIRRCWRYGQRHPVTVSIVTSEAEQHVVDNVKRKEVAAAALSARLIEQMADFERAEVRAS